MTTDVILRDNQTGYLTRLFRGNISLPMTYWVYFVIGSFLFNFLANFATLQTNSNGAILLIWATYIAFVAFMLIAVWRAAGNYGGSAIWSGLARVVVVLNIIGFVGAMVMVFNGQEMPQTNMPLDREVSEHFEKIDEQSYADVNEELNADLPKMLNDSFRLDSIKLNQDDTFKYEYTIVGYKAEDVSLTGLVDLVDAGIVEAFCKEGGQKDEGVVSSTFHYVGNDGRSVWTRTVDATDCI